MENAMAKKIPTPTIGEILREEFMEPLDITAYKLAKDIGVPTSRVLEILHGKRKVTADTSLRLAKYFGLTDKYFLDIQNDIDIRHLKEEQKDELDKIIPYSA
jgi:addiction module HigA family antidote